MFGKVGNRRKINTPMAPSVPTISGGLGEKNSTGKS